MSDLDIEMHNAIMDADTTSLQDMENLQAEMADYNNEEYVESLPTEETVEKRFIDSSDVVIGGVYFSAVNRDHYLVTSIYNDPIKWKTFWAKVWKMDDKWSEKKVPLSENAINTDFYSISKNAKVLSSLTK